MKYDSVDQPAYGVGDLETFGITDSSGSLVMDFSSDSGMESWRVDSLLHNNSQAYSRVSRAHEVVEETAGGPAQPSQPPKPPTPEGKDEEGKEDEDTVIIEQGYDPYGQLIASRESWESAMSIGIRMFSNCLTSYSDMIDSSAMFDDYFGEITVPTGNEMSRAGMSIPLANLFDGKKTEVTVYDRGLDQTPIARNASFMLGLGEKYDTSGIRRPVDFSELSDSPDITPEQLGIQKSLEIRSQRYESYSDKGGMKTYSNIYSADPGMMQNGSSVIDNVSGVGVVIQEISSAISNLSEAKSVERVVIERYIENGEVKSTEIYAPVITTIKNDSFVIENKYLDEDEFKKLYPDLINDILNNDIEPKYKYVKE